MRRFIEYAVELEKDTDNPEALAVARYIRDHQARLDGWLYDAVQLMPKYHRTRDDREELMQVALLAIVQLLRGHGAATGLNNVKNAMERAGSAMAAWRRRSIPLNATEE